MELRTSTESSTTVKSCLIAARYAGVKLNVVIDKSSTELTLGTQQGIVRGRSAVLRYVGRLCPGSHLEGRSNFESGLVDQWVEVAVNELSYLQGTSPEAEQHASEVLSMLEQHLMVRTFLAGERITLADIAVFCALEVFHSPENGGESSFALATTRWMKTCVNQPEFQGSDCIKAGGQGAGAGDVDGGAVNGSTSRAMPGMAGGSEPKLMEEFDEGNAALEKMKVLGVEAALYEHAAAFTVEEQAMALGSLPGLKTKNLFFKDKKAGLFLITARHDRPTDTKTLAKLLGLAGKPTLRFADAQTLSSVLGVVQGAVSPLAVVNDSECVVTLAIDKSLLDADSEKILVHPLRNDRTVSISAGDLLKGWTQQGVGLRVKTNTLLSNHLRHKEDDKFVTATGHEPKVLDFETIKAALLDPDCVKNTTITIDPNAAKKSVEKAKLAAKKVKHERSDPSSKAGMKKETLLAITASKFDDFPTWYHQVITLSEMIDFYDISGCYILRPWAYQIWEAIQQWMDKEIKALGVQNTYFPLFVSKRALETEKDHVEGFSAEVAWVTKMEANVLRDPEFRSADSFNVFGMRRGE